MLEQQALKMSPHRHVKLAIASKLRHAEMFRDLRKQWLQLHLTSRWIVTGNLASESTRPVTHWLQDNFDDIVRSEALLVYVEPEEHLRVALLEVGYALAHHKPVFLVGEHDDYKKWQSFVPFVHRYSTIEKALAEIQKIGEYKE